MSYAAGRVSAEPWRPALMLLFAPLALLMTAVLRVYFRRMRVRLDGALPTRGATLVVSNHPCTWVDAGVLDLALRRRLHFLTEDELFHPRARGWFLRIYGSLPVSIDDHDPEHVRRNAATFRSCEGLFDRGDAVALFPEGVSAADRALLPLHRGAARLALGYRRRAGARPLALVPVALHYADRTALRTEVTVTVGARIPLDDPAYDADMPLEAAAEGLTARIDAALRAGIADFACCGGRQAAALEPLVARGADPPPLETVQALAAALDTLAQRSPARLAGLLRRVRAYDRARHALRADDRALVAPGSRAGVRHAVGRAFVAALGLGPALAGAALHAVPVALIARSMRRHVRDASHVPLVRITAAMVWLPLWYIALALAVALASRSAWVVIACVVLAASSGVIAWAFAAAARGWVGRARVAWIAREHPRLVARARGLRAALLHDIEALVAGGRA